jgi:hypothetical protein
MLLDTRNKNIYSLGVGISTVFEIFWHFLFRGGWDHPYTPSDVHTQTKNIKNMYYLGVVISTIFDILGHFLFRGWVGSPRMVMTYIPSNAP